MKISNLIILIAILGAFACSSTTGVQQINADRKQVFDFDWKFQLAESDSINTNQLSAANWKEVNLPHDYSIVGEMNPENPMGNDGGYFPAGIGVYKKQFVVPNTLKGNKFAIYFEGVYMNAEVFINGISVGVQPYGYTSFQFDLSDFILFGKTNTLTVKVDNSQHKNSRWYSGSGIYRHVYMIVQNPTHINQWGVFVTTPKVTENTATVCVNTSIVNESNEPQTFSVNTTFFYKGEKLNSIVNDLSIDQSTKKSIDQVIQIERPKLWSTDSPNLYQANVQIVDGDKVIDEVTQTFGIRSIEYNAKEGFKLNGESIILYGGCVHHDNGALGAAAYDRAEERKVELLKEAGFNSVRTSHNPPSEAFLEACDRLGLLVIDESFDGWKVAKTPFDYSILFDEWWQHDVSSMVKRDRNHPSIIMWSIGNEIIERKDPDAVKTARMLAYQVKTHDPTRPVTSAMTTWDHDWEIFDPLMAEHDICGYNYQLHRAEADHQRAPERVIVQTESYPRDAFANWQLVEKHPYIIGDFVWTSIDYLGESGIGRTFYPGELPGQHWENNFFPWHGAYCGDIDLLGWRKPISHYRSMLFANTEKLYMAVKEPNPANGRITETMWSVWPTWESWTWPAFEGKTIEVEIYSKYPEIQFFQNGELIATKQNSIINEYKVTIPVTYTAGTIKAVAIENGEPVETVTLKTAGVAQKINLKADRTIIKADGQDLSYILVEIVDENGIVQFDANHHLNFSIEGAGEIVAIDNALLKDPTSYSSQVRNAWHGKAMAIVKSTRNSGKINLKVNNELLGEATIELTSK